MTSFVANKIFLESETASEQIKKARLEKNLSIKEISQKLKIDVKYLEALEKGEIEKIPSGVYSKNFLKEYCIFLGINYRKVLDVYEKELLAKQKKDQKEIFSRQITTAGNFLIVPKLIKNIIIGLAVVGCFFYLGYAIKNIVSPPLLIIKNPEENAIVNKKTVEVSGLTEKEAEIAINGERVLSDVEGYFNKEINLKEGINTIIITAKKKHGKESVVQRQILVKEE